jgi:hypothetical protein
MEPRVDSYYLRQAKAVLESVGNSACGVPDGVDVARYFGNEMVHAYYHHFETFFGTDEERRKEWLDQMEHADCDAVEWPAITLLCISFRINGLCPGHRPFQKEPGFRNDSAIDSCELEDDGADDCPLLDVQKTIINSFAKTPKAVEAE